MTMNADDLPPDIELWTRPLESETPPPPRDTDLYAAWLIRTIGDLAWNPDQDHDTGHTVEDFQAEMARLIAAYQRTGATADARAAAVHHAKLMHRRLLDLGYPVNATMGVAAFRWWMEHCKGWLTKAQPTVA